MNGSTNKSEQHVQAREQGPNIPAEGLAPRELKHSATNPFFMYVFVWIFLGFNYVFMFLPSTI